MKNPRNVRIISFSGIDGAGKSTQIEALRSLLDAAGLRVSILTMWDNIVVGSRFRETASRRAFRGDQGIGSPDRPLHRRDKNVTAWPLTLMRVGFYLADALSLAGRIAHLRSRSDDDVVIFDRFLYDELANLPLTRRWARGFASLLIRVLPKIDLAFVVDAQPDTAHARKPEYPLEFVRRNRQAYLAVCEIAGDICVVEAGSTDEMQSAIRAQVLAKVPLAQMPRPAADPMLAA
ncbi:MAG: thymidylate kinase [Candidatus Sulfotelmatobacter sp.]